MKAPEKKCSLQLSWALCISDFLASELNYTWVYLHKLAQVLGRPFRRYIKLLLSCDIGPAFHAMCPFLQDNQAIASTTYMDLIFLHGRELVQTEINKALTCLPHFTT